MVNDANYDMKGYLDMAEHIARKKLEMYSKLLEDIGDFKRRFAGELWPISPSISPESNLIYSEKTKMTLCNESNSLIIKNKDVRNIELIWIDLVKFKKRYNYFRMSCICDIEILFIKIEH